MRNLSFKIISPLHFQNQPQYTCGEPLVVYLGIYQEFPSLSVLRWPTKHSLKSWCSLA